jgi:NADH:ubiquinone oxidoreductase subunit D
MCLDSYQNSGILEGVLQVVLIIHGEYISASAYSHVCIGYMHRPTHLGQFNGIWAVRVVQW